MGCTANDLIRIAQKWVGYSEKNGKFKEILNVYNAHKPLARGYKIKTTDEWCAAFVSACAIKAGSVDLIGTEVSCNEFIEIFKEKGIWIEDGTVKPKVGDIVFFNWDQKTQPNDGAADHIGIVEQQYGNTIVCIEGNNGEAVARPKYDPDTTTIKPAKKSIDVIAHEVIRGMWGSGALRKSALTKAGYDYAEVQAKVNELMGAGKNSITAIAKEVIAGKWGNGTARRNALKRAGYDPDEVQKRVNELLR